VSYDNLVFTKLTLASVLANTETPTYEVIVVDNGSKDRTDEYLTSIKGSCARVRLVLNTENHGFAAATNQGIALARGQSLVLLNNDTIVPPGWLGRLVGYLQDQEVGAVGPVTNRIGNEAQVDATYQTYEGMLGFASRRAQAFVGRTFSVRTLAMFCLALRRQTWERIGPVDERFGLGLLEDDDYAERIRRAGLRLLCAEDVFVHHFGEASFGKLVSTGEHAGLLRRNQQRFEEKWGAPWEPYDRRPSADYLELRERVRSVVQHALPQGATVAIVSRGDDELLRHDGIQGWHFPQVDDGSYAGFYPADGAEAVQQVERLRARGASFILFPRTAFWWLEHYNALRWYLERKCELVSRDDACVVFALCSFGDVD
jgi:GT2 family glycosyltransferase